MKLFATPILFIALFSSAALADTAEPKPVEPKIVSRAEWKAAAPRTELMKRQTPKEIVIHHTGEMKRLSLSLETKLRNLQDFSFRPGKVGFHAKPPWGDVPYHYYIDATGRTGEGRDVAYAGDTNTGYDTVNIVQVVVEGNFEKEQPSKEQTHALEELVFWLEDKYGIDAHRVHGHGDKAPTDCPGKHLKPFVASLKKGPRNAGQQSGVVPAEKGAEPAPARR